MHTAKRLGRVAILALALVTIAVMAVPRIGTGADHLDGPALLTSPADLRGDARQHYEILTHCDVSLVDLSDAPLRPHLR